MDHRRPLSLACLAAFALLLSVAVGCSSDGGAADATSDAVSGADAAPPADTTAADAAADSAADATTPDATTPDAEADGGSDVAADTGSGEVALFRFGTAADQTISAAPFPNDLYLGADGNVHVAPFEDDPQIGGLAKATLLANYTAQANERTGFGSTSVVWFFTDGPVDEASLEGRVHIVGLAGPDAGREVAAQAFWSPQAGAVGVLHAWGDYFVAGSTYGVVLTQGITTVDGAAAAVPDDVRSLLASARAAEPLGALWDRWAPLRAWLDPSAVATDDVLVATVFTTEEVLPLARAVFDAVDAFALTPPTMNVRWDETGAAFDVAQPVEGADLDTYFGVTEAPFATNPGLWLGSRERAAQLPGTDGPYEGGTGHFGIGRVLNGSIEVPVYNFAAVDGQIVNRAFRFEGGLPQADLTALVPFTLYLCEEHLAAPGDLPVAIFSHGGGAIRADSSAWAVANCGIGVATIAIDMVFHGGRRAQFLHDGGLIVPTAADVQNAFTGKASGDEGYVTDWIGDDASAVASVAPLFAVGVDADPLVIEANLLTIVSDTATLLRYLREGDWSQVQPGLSFDPTRIVHESLSFGTSFHGALLALEDGFAAVVGSVASGEMLSANLLMAPVNATQAAAVLASVLGLKTPHTQFQTFSLVDPILSIHQWLHERGDPMVFAPFVLRHRPTDALPPVLHSGNSWDETLYSPAQISYAAALGLVSYTSGDEWTIDPTIPGAARIDAAPAPADAIHDNVTFGGRTTTAAIFWRNEACHGQMHAALCTQSYEHPYPPIQILHDPIARPSPICALQAQYRAFVRSVLEDGRAEIRPPSGTCDDLYGP